METVNVLVLSVLFCVLIIVTGAVDLDWQLVSYRYSEWHRSVEFWEYNPFFKLNWWLAYAFNSLRVGLGCLLLGFCLNEMRHLGEKRR